MPYVLNWKGKFGYATRIGYASDILNGQIVQKSGGPCSSPTRSQCSTSSILTSSCNGRRRPNSLSAPAAAPGSPSSSTTEAAGKNLLIAVTSFSFNSYPGGEGAAYLTAKEFNPLLDFVANGCKGAMAGASPSVGPNPGPGSGGASRGGHGGGGMQP